MGPSRATGRGTRSTELGFQVSKNSTAASLQQRKAAYETIGQLYASTMSSRKLQTNSIRLGSFHSGTGLCPSSCASFVSSELLSLRAFFHTLSTYSLWSQSREQRLSGGCKGRQRSEQNIAKRPGFFQMPQMLCEMCRHDAHTSRACPAADSASIGRSKRLGHQERYAYQESSRS